MLIHLASTVHHDSSTSSSRRANTDRRSELDRVLHWINLKPLVRMLPSQARMLPALGSRSSEDRWARLVHTTGNG